MILDAVGRADARPGGRSSVGDGEAVTDGELVRRHLAGDEGALRDLLLRHESALRRFVERGLPPAVRRRVAPDDVLQETWIVVARRLREFEDRGEGAFRAWAQAIAALKLREALRHEAGAACRGTDREVTRGARPETGAFAASAPSPSAHAVANELAEAVERAAGKLRPDDREILKLVQTDGLTIEQAAERTGRSREAARKQYERALERFARLVEAQRGRP